MNTSIKLGQMHEANMLGDSEKVKGSRQIRSKSPEFKMPLN